MSGPRLAILLCLNEGTQFLTGVFSHTWDQAVQGLTDPLKGASDTEEISEQILLLLEDI